MVYLVLIYQSGIFLQDYFCYTTIVNKMFRCSVIESHGLWWFNENKAQNEKKENGRESLHVSYCRVHNHVFKLKIPKS